MNTKIIKTLLKKEMLDVFRDKKTVLMMLLVPVLLYPLVFLGALQVSAWVTSGMEEQEYRIAVETGDGGAFYGWLEQQGALWEKELEAKRTDGKEEKKEEIKEESKPGKEAEEEQDAYKIAVLDAAGIPDHEQALENEEIDVYVSVRQKDNKMHYDVYYLASTANSPYAAGIVTDVLDGFREELTRKRVAEAGMDAEEILEPILYGKKNTASSEQSLGSMIGTILPFMLIVSLLMGTMYPAIDTTAGERERGTLETVLTLPVKNRDLLMAKFLTVAGIGMVSALLNILSMGGIAAYMYAMMDLQTEMEKIRMVKFLPAVLVCILAVFAFSLFLSAVTMCVTSFAKSYKEANNYITPLMLVVMFVGYIGFIPNLELSGGMSVMPVANICLLIKNIMVFKIDYGAIAAVLISNVSYAVLAILFLGRIYDSESLLFSDGKGGLQIFEKRGDMEKGGVPTVSDAVFVLALTFLLMMYVGGFLQMKAGLAGVFGTQMILLLVPLFLVVYTKRDIRRTYGFRGAGVRGYVGGVLVCAGMIFLNLVVSAGMVWLFPESAQNVETGFSDILGDNMTVALLVVALAPAVCEEMLFRGVVFHSLKGKYRAGISAAVTAALFGLFHMSLVKFLPTGLLGLVLCFVVWQTGSIYPAMLMHFLNNMFSVIVMFRQERLARIFPAFFRDSLSVTEGLLLAGIGGILIGIGIFVMRGRRKRIEPKSL